LRVWGENEKECCVESVQGMWREKRKFGTAIQSLLRIYCYMRNQRLEINKDK
jgi:hypothetical protein